DEAVLAADEPVELLLAELAGLAEHVIDQGGLAVVNVGDDGHVAQVGTLHFGCGLVKIMQRRGGGLLAGPGEATIIDKNAPPGLHCGLVGRDCWLRARNRVLASSRSPSCRAPGDPNLDLYLIRHAEALALGERGITDDADRPLSERGEGQAAAAARALQKR